MTCLCRLSTADHIVIWSARAWFRDRSAWDRIENELGGGLGAEAGPPLCRNLLKLYGLIDGATTRPVRLSPPKCPRVSEDEQFLIGALAGAQRNNWPLAVACLEDFLPHTHIRRAFEPVAAITTILRWAGYAFTPQPQLMSHAAIEAYRPGSARQGPIASH